MFVFGGQDNDKQLSNGASDNTSGSCNSDIDAVAEGIKSVNISDNGTDTSNTCANCGKEGSDVNNTCNKCKSVMYCNAACKKKDQKKHEKDCERRVAELYDENLFKQPPLQYEDCPICFQRMPSLRLGYRYKSCCGKVICSGCIHAVQMGDGVGLCPFCRVPTPTSTSSQLKGWRKEQK